MRHRCFVACANIAIIVGGSGPCVAANLVGVLKDQGAIDGCSWSASAKALGKASIFLAEYDESVAIMNIGGKDIHLQLDRKSSTGEVGRAGSQFSRTYTAPGIEVKATYTVTWACPTGRESCEVTKFKVIYSVQAGAATQVIEGRGDVGC
jgi:hypothetical protein